MLNYDPAKAKELWDKADKISKFKGSLPISYNADGNNNPWVDSLIDKAASSSPEEAVKVNEQIQQILFEDLPAVPLWYPNTTIGWSESVNNVAVSWNGTIPFWEISKV